MKLLAECPSDLHRKQLLIRNQFRSLGLSSNRCHARFETMKISLPGLTVQRSRVLLPRFCESVSYWIKLVNSRFGLLEYAD